MQISTLLTIACDCVVMMIKRKARNIENKHTGNERVRDIHVLDCHCEKCVQK